MIDKALGKGGVSVCACLCVCVRDCVYVESGWGGAVLNGGSIPSAYILEK